MILVMLLDSFATSTERLLMKSPPIKPDWKHKQEASINLSGIKVNYVTPSNLSPDYPLVLPTNKNLFDSGEYENNIYLNLDEKYWNYSKRILLITDKFGTLKMRAGIIKTITPVTQQTFQQIIEATVFRELSPIFPNVEKFHYNFESKLINNTNWLTYIEKLPNPNGQKQVYSTILTENHYLNITFQIIESKERDRANWYATALSDIEKIMNSFEIKKGTENMTTHKQFKVNLTPSD